MPKPPEVVWFGSHLLLAQSLVNTGDQFRRCEGLGHQPHGWIDQAIL